MGAYARDRLDENDRAAHLIRQQIWTAELRTAGVEVGALVERESNAVGDNRELPDRAWRNIYERFSPMYTYWWGDDELGADDEADPNTGLKGITVDVFNGLAGTCLCKVDIGIEYPNSANNVRK